MITGTIKTQVDAIWNAFWTGGISNPLEVIEQMTYLLFIKRLDELHTAREKKAAMLKKPIENPVFGPDQQHLRWSKFRLLGDAPTLHRVVANEVFPFIKNLGGDAGDSTSPGVGYLGVGVVRGEPVPAAEFEVQTPGGPRRYIEVGQVAEAMRAAAADPERTEYFVPVEWIETVTESQAVRETGLFGNQNSAAKPKSPDWPVTVERLKQAFGIE